jgi:hexosaminidase
MMYLAGVEGQAWSEYYTSTEKAAYMIFPRALALAELAWTPVTLRNYDDFLNRLRGQKLLMQHEGLQAEDNYDEISYTATPSQNNTVLVTLQSPLPGGEIRYTTDNSVPTPHSTLYGGMLSITGTTTLKALLFNKHKQTAGRLFQQHFRIHKAVGAPVVVKNKPVDRFNPGAEALVNGVFGSNRYNDSQWLGFSGSDLDAVIDLGAVQTIHRLGLHVLNYHWQRMWAPVSIQWFASTDGEHFTELCRQDSFPRNGINVLDVPVKPASARYIKVIGINKGAIPVGEYGAGGNSLLLIDELIVE